MDFCLRGEQRHTSENEFVRYTHAVERGPWSNESRVFYLTIGMDENVQTSVRVGFIVWNVHIDNVNIRVLTKFT